MMLDLSATGRQSFVRVLEVDPEFGAGLTAEESRLATKYLLARTTTLHPGEWDVARDCPPQSRRALGMLVIDGLLARRVHVSAGSAVSGERSVPFGSSLELLGSGDVARPWDPDDQPEDGLCTTTWSALRTTEVAWLDDEFAQVAARWPEIVAQLVRRAMQRAGNLARHLAISHIVGIESRVLLLLAYMSERWGRVTPDGVLIPVPLTNEMLGTIIGARPPSVSTALRKLAVAGVLLRRPDGSWMLHREALADVALPRVAAVSA